VDAIDENSTPNIGRFLANTVVVGMVRRRRNDGTVPEWIKVMDGFCIERKMMIVFE
jgi:hypothetical protein